LAIVLVVVLVLIAATVVLAAVFYVMVTGLTTGPPPNGAPTLTLAAGQWNNENLTIQITFVSSSTLAFPDLTFQVLSRTAAVCFLGAANGASQNRCAGAAVAVIYVDAQGDGRVDTLDSIRISASPNNEVRGGSLRVSLGGHTLTAITLP
jgi:hypothetical protein